MEGFEKIYSYCSLFDFFLTGNFDTTISLLSIGCITTFFGFTFFRFFLKYWSQLILLGPLILVGGIFSISFDVYTYTQKRRHYDIVKKENLIIEEKGIIKDLKYSENSIEIKIDSNTLLFRKYYNGKYQENFRIVESIKDRLLKDKKVVMVFTEKRHLLEVFIET